MDADPAELHIRLVSDPARTLSSLATTTDSSASSAAASPDEPKQNQTSSHPLDYLSLPQTELGDSAGSSAATAPRARIDAHASQALVKSILVLFGTLSLAQYAVAAAFFIRPLHFSITFKEDKNTRLLAFLPAIINITNKTTDAWLAAAVALVGLLAWERHLARRGTSIVEMEAWAALLSNKVPFTLLKATHLGVAPLMGFLFVIGVMAGATTAVTKAFTPEGGQVTVERAIFLPTLFRPNGDGVGAACKRSGGSSCPPSAFRDFVLGSQARASSPELSTRIANIDVRNDAIGLANPAVFLTYLERSQARGATFAPDKAFVQATMCMEGIAAAPECEFMFSSAVVVEQAAADNATGAGAVSSVRHTNSCGQAVSSFPMAEADDRGGLMDASTCVDEAEEVWMDWVFFGRYANMYPTNQRGRSEVHCKMNLAQRSAELNLTLPNGQPTIQPSANPRDCPLTPDPVTIFPNLSAQVDAVLATIVDLDGSLPAIYPPPNHPELIPASYLEILSTLIFRSVLTINSFEALSNDRKSSDRLGDSLRYGGGGPPGYPTQARETFSVIVLGKGSKAWLILLALGSLLIIGSMVTVFCRLLAFDPSDVGAVAAVALNSDVALKRRSGQRLVTRGDARRRLYLGEVASEPGRLVFETEPKPLGGSRRGGAGTRKGEERG